jgi:hypothetical protein
VASDTLTKAQREEALKIIRETVESAGGQAQAARRLGLKQQVLAKAFRDGAFGIGVVRSMATALGRAIAGIQPDSPDEGAASVEPDERYPSRPSAIAAARVLGKSEAALAAVEAMKLKSDDDPGLEVWLDKIDEVERILAKRTKTTTVDDSDLMAQPDPPPRKKR